MSNKINPKLKEGDRIVLVHMDGESLGTGIKGKVTKIEQTPKFSSSDLGFQYAVEWYDDGDDNVISRLSLIPESDAWILDSDYDIEPLQEMNIKDVDDLVSVGEFLGLFNRGELNKIYKFLELERRLGTHNMFTEGGKFILSGPDYIKDYIKLKSYESEFDEDKEEIIEKLIEMSQETKDIFIRAAIKLLENENKEVSVRNIQRSMQRLSNTAKKFWMQEAHKFINKEL
jgi:hypothetical protein